MHMYVCIYVCMSVRTYILYVRMVYLCVYVNMYVCMYVFLVFLVCVSCILYDCMQDTTENQQYSAE